MFFVGKILKRDTISIRSWLNHDLKSIANIDLGFSNMKSKDISIHIKVKFFTFV